MKKQLLSTLAASVLLLSTSVVQAQDAPSRTECIAPAKPGRRLRSHLQTDSGQPAGDEGH